MSGGRGKYPAANVEKTGWGLTSRANHKSLITAIFTESKKKRGGEGEEDLRCPVFRPRNDAHDNVYSAYAFAWMKNLPLTGYR